MTITATQKIIKVGSSGAVTVPAKVMKQFGATYGDDIQVEFKPVIKKRKHDELMNEYDEFVKQYGQTLKNLADR